MACVPCYIPYLASLLGLTAGVKAIKGGGQVRRTKKRRTKKRRTKKRRTKKRTTKKRTTKKRTTKKRKLTSS